MPVCSDCGGTVIEYDAAAGNGFCVQCGTVVEENTIVSEITFGESSNGAALVQGSYVGLGSTRARMGGPLGNRGSNESREQTIANASRKIYSIANVLHLSESIQLTATRLYTLAVEHKFTKGRKSMNVVAVCLYVACRQKDTRNYMLIDFSDLLQVNVFELGHCYLQLVQTLNLRLPLLDPSHFIPRYASLLEFGSQTSTVSLDAIRLVQRFDRDWLNKGRRPSGICGAALLLAARMNNFRRSVEEIVQVVKIGEGTVRKRIEEFRGTGSAGLSVEDFRRVWLEEEEDPPAFTKGRERDKEKEMEKEGGVEEGEEGDVDKKGKKKRKGKGGKKRKRKKDDGDGREEIEGMQNCSEVPQSWEGVTVSPHNSQDASPHLPVIDPALFNEGILAGAISEPFPQEIMFPHSQPSTCLNLNPLFLPDDEPDTLDDPSYANIDPSLLPPRPPREPTPTIPTTSQPQPSQSEAAFSSLPLPPSLPTETQPPQLTPTEPLASSPETDPLLTSEIALYLTATPATALTSALDEAESRRLALISSSLQDELQGLDEEELDAFLLSEEEVKIKERVWVELNREYLESIVARGLGGDDASAKAKSRKRRKTDKPRDASTPHGSTAAESVQNLLKKNAKYSKRINYDALKDLFTEGSKVPGLSYDDKEEEDMYTLDDKSDGEIIVEEGGGEVGVRRGTPNSKGKERLGVVEDEIDGGDADAEGELVDEVGGEADYGWEEAYEQEA
ncbi:hypothetical protein JAAARDRAFT_34333 [Jaapia argillacea MUCL 33604]|uniref:B-related factor 1 n=1 Tax=Jaapia argillacea MUCL 33604 TaxID=933084 RepID=A0A067PUY1_9AGAM|nr:hypothetical protein JAAARDRAFT_34333 [Jaapia argillacea MUCL 33604]